MPMYSSRAKVARGGGLVPKLKTGQNEGLEENHIAWLKSSLWLLPEVDIPISLLPDVESLHVK